MCLSGTCKTLGLIPGTAAWEGNERRGEQNGTDGAADKDRIFITDHHL